MNFDILNDRVQVCMLLTLAGCGVKRPATERGIAGEIERRADPAGCWSCGSDGCGVMGLADPSRHAGLSGSDGCCILWPGPIQVAHPTTTT